MLVDAVTRVCDPAITAAAVDAEFVSGAAPTTAPLAAVPAAGVASAARIAAVLWTRLRNLAVTFASEVELGGSSVK